MTFFGSRSTGMVLLSSMPSMARAVCEGKPAGMGCFTKCTTCATIGVLPVVLAGGRCSVNFSSGRAIR